MHITNILLIVVAGMNLGLALSVFFRNPKNKINQTFALSVFLVAGWSFFMALFREQTVENDALFYNKILDGFGALVAPSFFLFAHFFPYQKDRLTSKFKTFFVASTSLMLVDTLYLWIDGVKIIDSGFLTGNTSVLNYYGYGYFVLYFMFYILLAFYILVKKYIESTEFTRTRLKYILLGTLPFGVIATSISVIFAPLTFGYLYIGPLSAVIMLFYISYFMFFCANK